MAFKLLPVAAACVALSIAIVGCAKKEQSSAEQAAMADAVPAAAPDGRMAAAPAAKVAASKREEAEADTDVTSATVAQQMGSSSATYTDSERKFIRTAKARFGVKDVYVSALAIEDIVATHGGFVTRNDINSVATASQEHPVGDGKLMNLTTYAVQGELTVRVPSTRTQEFLRAIVGHIVFLDERRFAARDAQFDLLRRQLEALRAQQTQADLGDVIDEGGKLRQKTEAIGTRHAVKAARDEALIAKKEFDDQVAFSTIDLSLYQPARVVKTERVDIDAVYRENRPGFFSRLGESLRGGWNGLLECVIGLATIWPVLLIGAAVAGLWRALRHRRKAASSAQ